MIGDDDWFNNIIVACMALATVGCIYDLVRTTVQFYYWGWLK